jgi:acetyl esterase
MLDLNLDAMMKQVQAAGLPDLSDLPPDAARGLYQQILAAADRPAADVAVAQAEVPAQASAPAVQLRIYTPRSVGAHALVLYYHGGGYMLGDLDGYDNVCRQLCQDSDAVVVSVGYRLVPEHTQLEGVDDAWAALCWAAEHAAEFGADAARLGVAGDSAGAVLATVVSLLARDAQGPKIRFQALLYPPAAGGHGDYASRITHAAGPTLTQRSMDYFNRYAFGPSGKASDFRGAPLLAQDLSGLPPTWLAVAGHDPLHDEVLAYGNALLAAGTPVVMVEYHGLAHGFISMAGAIATARLAQQQFALVLREGLV